MSAPLMRALLTAQGLRSPLLLEGVRALGSVQAAATACNNAVQTASHHASLRLDRRGLAAQAQAAQEPASDAAAADAAASTSGEDELALLKAAVDKFVPDAAMQEAFRINEVSRLRLADLPANRQFMESFAGDKLPSQPLYDLPSWLEHSYPQYDASPKSPFYSWAAWARDNLPREQQRLLHAFHEYMQSDRFRPRVIRQANFELARLWRWQHQRVAAGLPPDLTPAELAAAAARIAAAVTEAEAASTSSSSTPSSTSAPSLQQGGATGSASSTSASSATAAKAAAATEEPKPAPKPKAASSGPLSGILGIIQQADKKQQEAQEESREQLAAQGLTELSPEQRTLVASLKSVDAELRSLAYAFDERLSRGRDMMRQPGPSRGKDLLRAELEARAAAVVEATNSGQDYKDIESHTTLYNPKGDALDGKGPGFDPQLRRLYPQDLRQALEGHALWTQSQLLDIQANQQAAAAKSSELQKAVQEVKEADERLAREGDNHGYVWDLSVRPPTPTLDKLTEYLQVKYMDVLLQRRDAHALLSHAPTQQQQQQQQHAFTGLLAQPQSRNAWQALSPEEVHRLNEQATKAFEEVGKTGSMAAYAALMRGMYSDGIIGEVELQESLAAARIRAAEARAAARAPAPASSPTTSASSTASLLSLLTGSSTPSPSSSSSSSSSASSSSSSTTAAAAAVSSSAVAESQARQLWEEASKSSFAGWSKALSQHIKDDIAARRAQGEQVSVQQEAELLSWWQQPVTFSEAQQAWSSYLAAAGMPHGPQLEEVIVADQAARTGGAQGAGTGVSGAQVVAGQLQEVFEAFTARHGSTIYSAANTSSTSTSSGSGSGGGARGVGSEGELSWADVQRCNAGLDVASGEALASTFQAPSLRQVLSQHWEDTARRLLPEGSLASSSSSGSSGAAAVKSVGSFEELWGLMLNVYDTTLSQASTRASSSSSSDGSSSGSGSGSSGSSAGAGAGSTSGSVAAEDAQAFGPWSSYIEALGGEASSLHTVPGSPPYTGAKPILRFRQTFVLSPTPSTATTSVATSGFGPGSQPGSLESHPTNRGVELRVAVRDLQQEAGLSDEAMQVVLDVCGPERLDSKREELVLRADCYAAREENRRLLLEQLHALIAEAQALAPSASAQASPLQQLLAKARSKA